MKAPAGQATPAVGGVTVVRKATFTDLMPLPWLRPEETGWAVHPPVPGSVR